MEKLASRKSCLVLRVDHEQAAVIEAVTFDTIKTRTVTVRSVVRAMEPNPNDPAVNRTTRTDLVNVSSMIGLAKVQS